MKRSPMARTGILRVASHDLAAKLVKGPRLRKCAVCRAPFTPHDLMRDKWCSVECGAALGLRIVAAKKAKAQRIERSADKLRKDAIKTRGDWIKEVQITFNKFIRIRDRAQPCICCGKPFEPAKFGGSMDAGHYLSRGAAPHLRFDERNVHGQRKNCNRPGGTTREAFRKGMAARIGAAALDALECDQRSRDWTIDDLKAIKAEYKLKLKGLQA